MGKLAGAVGLTRDDGRDTNRGRDKAIYAARNPHWSHEAVLYFPSFRTLLMKATL